MTVLAVVFPLGAAFTVEHWLSRVALLVTALAVAIAGLPLWSHLRRTTVDPEGVLFRSLDENLEQRALVTETVQRRRTGYASDQRPAPDGPVLLPLRQTRYASDRREADENV